MKERPTMSTTLAHRRERHKIGTPQPCSERTPSSLEETSSSVPDQNRLHRQTIDDAAVPEARHCGYELQRNYDEGDGARKASLLGLCIVWILSLTCTIAAAVCIPKHGSQLIAVSFEGPVVTVVLPLLTAALITLSNESLGFIHAVALRWALWQEGRLRYNTSLRLVSSSKCSTPNHWTFNLIYFLAVVISYVAAGQLFEGSNNGLAPTEINAYNEAFTANLISLAVLGGALLIQSGITTCALHATRNVILSWSSNSLNTTLICY